MSNGTAAGTALVGDIRPGPYGSYPHYLKNFNGNLFFSANDGVHGFEPWVLSVPAPPSGLVTGLSPGDVGLVGSVPPDSTITRFVRETESFPSVHLSNWLFTNELAPPPLSPSSTWSDQEQNLLPAGTQQWPTLDGFFTELDGKESRTQLAW
jgi:ELWxxDGT repeat protein